MPEQIQREHVESALNYIIEHRMKGWTGVRVCYLKRSGGDPDEYAPDGWATRHVDAKCGDTEEWVGMKETVRVAYLYSCGMLPDPDFSDEDLIRVDGFLPMWGRGKKILKALGFPCEDRRLASQ